MPVIIPFVIQAVLPVLTSIFAMLVPVIAEIIKYTLTCIPRIPSYILLLKILYSDIDSSSQERKILNGGLLVIGSIVTFMAYSLIPWTGIPLIGAVTSPIAGAVALVVALALLDIIFTINEGYYLKRLRGLEQQRGKKFTLLEGLETDIKGLKDIFGKSWDKVKSTIKDSSHKIYEEGCKRGINFSDKNYQKFIDYALEGLEVYIGKDSIAEYEGINADLLNKNKGQDWTKDAFSVGTGATVGALAGVGASAVASSVFVPASILTTIQGFFGISTGVVIGASTYSLLTLAAPVGLGVLATVGIYSSLTNWKNQEEAAKMSKFLAEIIIAALPMAWIDNTLADEEKDTIDRFITNSGMRKEERDLVWKAIEERQNFDDIMKTSILFDEEHRNTTCSQSNNEQLKHRLILCTAWNIAIADGTINLSEELNFHNRMADKLGISREEVKEIRRAINLKQVIWQVMEVVEINGSTTMSLRNIHEQYCLQPVADNL